jgi:hypothetical protein
LFIGMWLNVLGLLSPVSRRSRRYVMVCRRWNGGHQAVATCLARWHPEFVSNHAHRRAPSDLISLDPLPGFWKRVRLFLVWFFAPRAFPSAWQRRPYLRNPDRPPGKFTR